MIWPHGENDVISPLRAGQSSIQPPIPPRSPLISVSVSAQKDEFGVAMPGFGHPLSSLSLLAVSRRSDPLTVMRQTDIATVI